MTSRVSDRFATFPNLPGVQVLEKRGRLILGRGAHINEGTRVRCVGCNVTLETDANVSYDCHLVTAYGSHYLGHHAEERNGPILIRAHAWVGHGAMIRGNVTIGRWAVVGMGAVVTHDVPDYMVAAGNPARVLHRRPDYEDILKQAGKA